MARRAILPGPARLYVSAVADDDEPRTFSIWAFVAVFVLLGAVGLVGVLIVGNSNSETVQLPVEQTTSTTEATTTTAAAAGGGTTPVTMPDGTPAPEGVQDVVSDAGSHVVRIRHPAGARRGAGPYRGGPGHGVPDAEGTSLEVTVTCAAGVGEALAQLSITEDAIHRHGPARRAGPADVAGLRPGHGAADHHRAAGHPAGRTPGGAGAGGH